MPDDILRIFDANVNRACEGLRVVEEVCRFILNDAGLSDRLKKARHSVRSILESERLIPHRDSENDVGKGVLKYGSGARTGLPDIIDANLKRAEEALRVIEEFSKLEELDIPLDNIRAIEAVRFEVYTLEKEIFSLAQANNKFRK